jgi:L-alanine-DL-glutamate epimerase-like enolase superfamily enzyme
MVTLWCVVNRKYDVKTEVLTLPLAERFTIARESWDEVDNVFVTVSCDGETGRGEGFPAASKGESAPNMVRAIAELDLDSVLASPFDLEGLARAMPPGGARCALDIALHDLAARLAGVSLSHLLGLGGLPLPPTSVTIPIAHRDAMVERARGLAGYPAVKVKVGFDGDVDAVAAIRASYSGRIRVDANEGWSADEAIARLTAMSSHDVELCEQPVKSGNLDDLERVASSSPIAVFADEDADTAADVARLAGRVHGVNLKLRKCGGIREAIRAVHVARAHGLAAMLGCDLESGIASTAAAHIASLFDYVDLDGSLLLAQDPFPGVRYAAGTLLLPDGPGLGIEEVPA